jgi:hypothetical protein
MQEKFRQKPPTAPRPKCGEVGLNVRIYNGVQLALLEVAISLRIILRGIYTLNSSQIYGPNLRIMLPFLTMRHYEG